MDTLKFNKFPESYWLASTEKSNYSALNEDINVDIAIVGGGMVGMATAYQLKDHGLKIAVLEAEEILSSTTAHTTGKITSQHGLIYNKLIKQFGEDLAKQYAQANERAVKVIKEIAEENNIDCEYLSQSSYVYTQEENKIKNIEAEVKAATSLGIEASYVDEIPFDMEIRAGVRFNNQAQFHPRKFLLPLAEIIHKKGISIYEHSRVIDLEEDGHEYVLLTSQGKKVRAKKVIIASHYPFYNKASMYFSKIYVERSYILAITAKEVFPGGMYINTDDPSRSLRSQKIKDGELIFLAGEKHKVGQSENTGLHYRNLIQFAKGLFTIEEMPYRWSTQDCMTIDGVPFVGYFTDDTPNLYIATGFQKWGMTNSIVSSMILRDLIIKGESPWQDIYSPSRKNLMASAQEFVAQNVNVAGQLLKGKFSKLPDELDIGLGEGKVFKHDGERIGVYRDDKGELFFVDTTCTHMGCELNWNDAERSWDCPCHGSRFTFQGHVIHGPAVRPLNFDKDVNILMRLIKEDF